MASRTKDRRLRKDLLPVAPLPQRAVYALRAMAILANLEPGASLPSAELAERATIPGAYVSKVMRRLAAGGLVDARRGHGGGFRLARPAARIPFTAILEAVDCELDPQQCVFGFERCDSAQPCVLHESWGRLRAALVDWADGTLLAETAGRPHGQIAMRIPPEAASP